MLVDQSQTAVRVQNGHEAVKVGDHAPRLEAVHQKHSDGHPLLADAIEEDLLQVVCLFRIVCSFAVLCRRYACIIARRD